MAVTTEEELGKALESGQDTIEITGSLKDKVIKIKAVGHVSWAVAIGAVGIAVIAILSTGGVAAPASAGIVGVGAASVLGIPAATSAVWIAVAAGGVGALNKLRSYKIESNSGNVLVLKKGG